MSGKPPASSARPRPRPGAGRRPPPKPARPPQQPRAAAPDFAPPPFEAEQSPGAVRLQKILSSAGIASRRKAEELIVAGRVTVNGRVVQTLGARADPSVDRVEVDGERIGVGKDHEYLMLNKPAGVITTANDPFGRPTVLDVAAPRRRIYPVGRLDADTSGLLLLTDDGELAHRLAHPRYGIEKTYVAKISGKIEAPAVRRLATGVSLDDGPARAARVRVRATATKTSQVEIVMTEGRKREVRRMLEAVGHPVVDLVRVGFGPLRLGTLAVGETRRLTPKEVGEFYRLVGL